MSRPGNWDQGGKSRFTQETQILQALEMIHNPHSSNALRHQASRYLEDLRSDDEAPLYGFGLASAKEQSAIVRHYGLSLIDYGVRRKWTDYSQEQNAALRQWVLDLANNSSEQDPSYITNKIAEIWVEMAKRSWALDWMNMDELLARLWDGHAAQKILVLVILEALSDEVYGSEDSVAALRGTEFSRACVEIFTPANVLTEQFPNREAISNIRYGTDGWLARMADVLGWCLDESKISQERQIIATKILSTLKSAVSWVIPRALVGTSTVQRLCNCLAYSAMPVQLVSKFQRRLKLEDLLTTVRRQRWILFMLCITARDSPRMTSGI